MWSPTRFGQPNAEPLTLAEIKRQLRIDFVDDDTYLGELIASARSHVEDYCGRWFATRSAASDASTWADMAALPFEPNGAVVVSYVDAVGAAAVVDADDYTIEGCALVLVDGAAWPDTQPGSVITVTGSVTPDCPPSVKHAMRLWIASAYEVREDSPIDGRTAFDNLLTNHRGER